jgi:hypothetical protein
VKNKLEAKHSKWINEWPESNKLGLTQMQWLV